MADLILGAQNQHQQQQQQHQQQHQHQHQQQHQHQPQPQHPVHSVSIGVVLTSAIFHVIMVSIIFNTSILQLMQKKTDLFQNS